MEGLSTEHISKHFSHIRSHLRSHRPRSKRYGKVSTVIGTIIECTGLEACVGEIFGIHTITGKIVEAEVVGLQEERTLLMPYDRVEGMKSGCLVESFGQALTVPVGEEMLGRVVDANASPIDNLGPLQTSGHQEVQNSPPAPLERNRIDDIMFTGIRALDSLNTIGTGQRLGLFAGSGVGKSVLLGMIAKHSAADVNVIALIGERGREVQEFIEDTLGDDGMKRSVVVAVTSDMAAMSRIKGAFTATAIAEYFRDQGKDVLLMMDSITRVAMALREVGLATGEPPATRGYPPSVFAKLPRLLERTGTNDKGTITALYTVLVEGDDFNEPVSDTVRGILDGHIDLSRELASRNHYPAIDVLSSVSRVMDDIVNEDHIEAAGELKKMLANYRESEDLINIGAYEEGSNPAVDRAIEHIDDINDFLQQGITEKSNFSQTLQKLKRVVK